MLQGSWIHLCILFTKFCDFIVSLKFFFISKFQCNFIFTNKSCIFAFLYKNEINRNNYCFEKRGKFSAFHRSQPKTNCVKSTLNCQSRKIAFNFDIIIIFRVIVYTSEFQARSWKRVNCRGEHVCRSFYYLRYYEKQSIEFSEERAGKLVVMQSKIFMRAKLIKWPEVKFYCLICRVLLQCNILKI